MLDETRIKARDVMQTEVVKLHCQTPIQRAVEILEEYKISGAPVIDEAEGLVGVLSASDIMKTGRFHKVEYQHSDYYLFDPLDEDEVVTYGQEDYDGQVLERESVVDYMTPKIISVDPESSLADVCRLMVKEEIHRVFVVQENRLLGVISTFDVVRRLAEASKK